MSGLTGTTVSGSATPPLASRTPSLFDVGTVDKCVPYLETFAPFRASGKFVHEVIKAAVLAGHHLPKKDKGVNMCVSYHVKGVCNTNCGRNSDHAPHNTNETARFVVWRSSSFVT